MSPTETLIRDLKRRLNPATGTGYTYGEIGSMLGISKQAAAQHIKFKAGCCESCLQPLKKGRRKVCA